MLNVKRRKFLLTVLSIIFLGCSILLAGWDIMDMGDAGTIEGVMNGVVVAAIRPDGISRVYASNGNTQIYEFTYLSNTNSWKKIDIGTADAQAISAIAVGNGRNDGVNRLYVAAQDCHMYELTPASGTWVWVDMGAGAAGSNYGMLGVALGNGRNDGVIRVYGSSDNAHLYEFTYSAGAWHLVDLGIGYWNSGGSSGPMNKVAVGQGRNDGLNRVYAANNDSNVYEFSWSLTGSTWTCWGMGTNGSYMRDVVVGNGRNDGVNRVYAANLDGRPFEYSWTGSTWTWCDVDNAELVYANSWLERIIISSGIEDGNMRLYGADHDTHIWEYSYGYDSYNAIGDTFTKTSIGYCSNFMQAVGAGNGRNDGITRIYAANYNYHLYEFSYTTATTIALTQSDNNIGNSVVYPTFANLSKGDKINFANFTPRAHITIITLAGHTIKKMQADVNGTIPPWDGTVENGGKAASGTYIIHAADNLGNYKVFKILLIK